MNTAPFKLEADFASALPTMAAPWQGEEAPNPELVILNDDLAYSLGLDPTWLRTPEGVQFLLGLNPEPLTKAVAQAYSGHQFGQFVASLGDGRALLLGEARTADGVLHDIHLKGSGRTQFSRGADGRAVLGPVLREYIISEAMHALGVPTTRSLAVISTGKKIQRGSVAPGAVLVRVATSLIRVGSFQYSNISGGIELSQHLANYTITRHFPSLVAELSAPTPATYVSLFKAILQRQADTVGKWTRLGFVHGALNTDNTLISGETVDYGPCAFMERYRGDAKFSSIDTYGRYKFENQPMILGWNMARLVETLLPLLGATPDEGMTAAQEALGEFDDLCEQAIRKEFANALGLDESDTGTVEQFRELLYLHNPDITTLLRALTDNTAPPSGFEAFVHDWKTQDPDIEAMQAVNPLFIPRNHLVEAALADAVEGNLEKFHKLLAAVTNPFDPTAGPDELRLPSEEGFEEDYMTFCGT
ncbi:YdiU family protein [Corynebacterium glutamicum]|uniref:protein adenylyltransferase SelO n=1 Tax=Corynebacterium glutamicum TaxID=1718 RepID=UPI001C6E59C0|nr:YdiU family protein [Corynebacterium glutamicum]QYR16604.1 YdiU family protein [Corynebacterium glutamicum]